MPVEFVCQVPSPGPVSIQLHGVTRPLPMSPKAGLWSLTLALAPGVYLYRFELSNGITVNDCRRTTERNLNGQWWSLLHVTPEGPVWVDRSHPQISSVAICRGIGEMTVPLMVVDHVSVADFPVILWTHLRHVYRDSVMQVFLLRPDRELAFGAEFVLEQAKASPDFELRFWMSVEVEPSSVVVGEWKFLLRAERGQEFTTPMFVEA